MATVAFTGNLGKVKQIEFNSEGKPRISFSVGESTREKQQDGSWGNSATTWWNVTVFGFQAEDLADALQEGAKQRVTVAGRSKTREYQKTDGTMGSSLDVVADFVGLVPASNRQQGQQRTQEQPQQGNWGQQPVNAGGWGNGPTNGEAPF